MPSPILHMAIAKKVNEELNYDLDLFMLGNLIPDFATWEKTKNTHVVTHFRDGNPLGLANPDAFLQKYHNMVNDVLAMGYLTHLLADKYFNNFIFTHSFIYKKGRLVGVKKKNGKVEYLTQDGCKNMKYHDFNKFEIEIVHNKYITYLENHCHQLPNIEEVNNLTIDKIPTAIENINYLIKKKKRFAFLTRYNLVTSKTMHEEFNNCCDYIINYLKEHHLIKKGS